MLTKEQKEQTNNILESITQELDIPESKYIEAKNRYEAVGNWLCREESILKNYNPTIYPQGSFNLGTMVKPINDVDGYDVDLVCELQCKKSDIAQKELKELVGSEIILYAERKKIKERPENNTRCWTLDYANEFHMDILPAIPDKESFEFLLKSENLYADHTDTAIAITDKKYPTYPIISNDWLQSNPKGYLKWFKNCMQLIFIARKGILAKALNENIANIPDYLVKTPLQRAVQLLKRHRDIYFSGKDNKPISIIITTLAGHAYSNEPDIYDAIINIVNRIQSIDAYIKDGKYQILNPVNPKENFADKWNKNHELPDAFQGWIRKVKEDFNNVFQIKGLQKVSESLYPIYGENLIKAAMSRFGDDYYSSRKSGSLKMSAGTGILSSIGTKQVQDHNFYGK